MTLRLLECNVGLGRLTQLGYPAQGLERLRGLLNSTQRPAVGDRSHGGGQDDDALRLSELSQRRPSQDQHDRRPHRI